MVLGTLNAEVSQHASNIDNVSEVQFSLYFFASHESTDPSQDKYQLMLESAKFADANDFVAVWTPERHFHAFGGLSPNPSVTGAALAVSTQNVQIRSGSVVLGLHNPVRVAEEWALVDNLSKGRVGLGVASGWFPNDFILAADPQCYHRRSEELFDDIETIKNLWKGGTFRSTNPLGDTIEIQSMPRPIQDDLEIWVTSARNPETFRRAGEIGANTLTHLLGQRIEELAEKIEVYRDAWKAAGHPGEGKISLMLHTFVGESEEEVRDIVREPMKKYLGSSINLVKNYVNSLPIFKSKQDIDVSDLTPSDIDQILEFSFEKYYQTASLLGTPERCLKTVDKLRSIGVNEVACLVDFGVDTEIVLESLKSLNGLRIEANCPNRLKNLKGPKTETAPEAEFKSIPKLNRPRTVSEVERILQEIWMEVLQIRDINLDTNFFDAGGHSLLIVKMHCEIQDRLGIKFSLVDLFTLPTIRTSAKHLAKIA